MNEKIFDFLFSKNKKKSLVFSKDETDGVVEEEDKNYLCCAVVLFVVDMYLTG
jgi:hypothetical protein